MAKKSGRNDPCSCGSGKKYKKCCINLDISSYNSFKEGETSKAFEYIESHESKHILNTLIGIQLIPENHGKNVRIEELAKHIAINLNNKLTGERELLLKCLEKEYSYNSMEDFPENLFCENVVFFGGNYTVFPGISTNSVEIFRYFSESIFAINNKLPDDFKNYVFHGISLLLVLGQFLAEKANLNGNIVGTESEHNFKLYPSNISFSIKKEELYQLCREKRINFSVVNDFILSPNNERFKIDEPDLNPLLFYPIVEFENEYYFLMLSNQVNAINEFILRQSKKYNCEKALLINYHYKMWYEILSVCDRMKWTLTDIEIPKQTDNQNVVEAIFKFDTNRLAYIALFNETTVNDIYEPDTDEQIIYKSPDERMSEVISHLNSQKKFEDFKFLTIFTYGSFGRDMFTWFDKPNVNEFKLTFSGFKFIALAKSELWDKLSLWKFAKVFDDFLNKTKNFADTVDAYNMYKSKGQNFYFSDDTRADVVAFVPGEGNQLIKEIKVKNNYHGALARIGYHLAYIPVVLYADFAPLYAPCSQIGYYLILLETFKFPFWIVNHQVHNESMFENVQNYTNAIGFWLNKLRPAIAEILNAKITYPLEFEIILDDKIFQNNTSLELNIELKNKEEQDSFTFKYENNKISFNIPFGTLSAFIGGKNDGERAMMKSILEAFNLIDGINFSETLIAYSLDRYIPLGNSKMILLTDSKDDLSTDNRWLVSPLYISDAEINLLLDELPSLIEIQYTIPERIDKTADKIKFFNLATTVLIDKLSEEIQIFDNKYLLNQLVELHESLIWEREHNKTIIPAQILCFGGLENKTKEILNNEENLVKTTLALRCLIEFLAASPVSGTLKVSYDEIDRLLVLMHEIANYGFLSDSVHFKMDNPKVGKLKSGRIGISRGFYEDKLQPFVLAYTKEGIDSYLENFDSRFNVFTKSEPKSNTKGDKELAELNKAFLNDWGISYQNIYKFCHFLANLCLENSSSVISMNKNDLIKRLNDEFVLPNEEINAGIARFSLSSRPDYLVAPDGFKNNEVYPWKYNREFSFARRFIISHQDVLGNNLLTWGFRNAISAEKQLYYLLMEGKLNNGGNKIQELLGIFRQRKGKQYRNQAKDWLKQQEGLMVIDYEVDISPNGHLKAVKKYGDIDILAFNTKTKTIFSIECKDTNKAKNIHEMKKEMDNYLGREGGDGMINKHLERHNWLNDNKIKIKDFLMIEGDFIVKSFMLTSEVIPTY